MVQSTYLFFITIFSNSFFLEIRRNRKEEAPNTIAFVAICRGFIGGVVIQLESRVFNGTEVQAKGDPVFRIATYRGVKIDPVPARDGCEHGF